MDPTRIHVIYNGIDTSLYQAAPGADVLAKYGIDPNRPSAIFVGRITRQKGLKHLLAAASSFDPSIQLILCAGAPDTPEITVETETMVADLQKDRTGVVWIREMLPRPEVDCPPERVDGVRVPVDLRTARHRQPGGHGL